MATKKKDLEKGVNKNNFVKGLYYFFLCLVSLSMVFPFYWMFVMALKTPEEHSIYPPALLPERFNLDNFIKVIQNTDFPRYFWNSFICTFVETFLVLIITVISAYGFYMMKAKSKSILVHILLLANTIPFEIVMIFNFKMMIGWGVSDNLWALIVPFICNFTYVYILYHSFNSIPIQLINASKIDKTNQMRFLFRIALPYVKPTLIFICIMNMVGSWNSFTWPLLITNSVNNRTLPIAIYSFVPEYGSRMELVMAMSVLSQLPMVILFGFLQKYLIDTKGKGLTVL